MKLCSLVPNTYIHVSVSNYYVFSLYQSACLVAAKWADLSWEYKNRTQIHECENWETEHYDSVLEITRQDSFISGNT
jgi:hypothetical protein